MVRGHLIDVEGTLTFPGMPSFDLSECVGFAGDAKKSFHNPQGPKPKGKVPANDLPAGALSLSVGSEDEPSRHGQQPSTRKLATHAWRSWTRSPARRR